MTKGLAVDQLSIDLSFDSHKKIYHCEYAAD